MVLGLDFGNESNYGFLDLRGEVDINPTWRHLKTLLSDIHIKPELCFFTNAYTGLRKTDRQIAGPVPEVLKKATRFTEQCQNFLHYQLRMIQPELILVLGKEPAGFLAGMFPEALHNWKDIGNLKDFYQVKEQISYEIEAEGRKTQALFVMHPSMSNSNRGIIWKGKNGREEETGLLKKRLGEFYKRHGIQFK
jgi:uracil-DNA glycosylase